MKFGGSVAVLVVLTLVVPSIVVVPGESGSVGAEHPATNIVRITRSTRIFLGIAVDHKQLISVLC